MDPKYIGIAWTGTALIDVRAPCPSLINLRDIARGLSRQYRFNGQTRDDLPPYSVAWHSLFCESVADAMGLPIEVRLQALLHDAPEFILGDMVSPIKVLCPEYAGLESRLWSAIAERFQVPNEFHPAVKQIDQIAFEVERKHLVEPDAWPPAPEISDQWGAMGKAWIAFAQSRTPDWQLSAALFHSRVMALMDARDRMAS